MNGTRFFPRLAAVPGVTYSGPPNINRKKLPEAKAKPRIETFSDGGKVHSFAMWDTNEGVSTSQSPAAVHFSIDRDSDTPSEVLTRLDETLELPGSAADYHFALLAAYEWLSKQCRTKPDLLADLERLCLLDVSLVEACPQATSLGADEEPYMVSIPAFHHLIRIYEREGFIADALAIALRAAACGQGTAEQERLTSRIQELKSEDA